MEKIIKIKLVKFVGKYVEIYSAESDKCEITAKSYVLWQCLENSGIDEDEIYNYGFVGRRLRIQSTSASGHDWEIKEFIKRRARPKNP